MNLRVLGAYCVLGLAAGCFSESDPPAASCEVGTLICPCFANSTCNAELVCDAALGVCLPEDCMPGVVNCPCDDGACGDGLSCEAGVCTEPATNTGGDATSAATGGMSGATGTDSADSSTNGVSATGTSAATTNSTGSSESTDDPVQACDLVTQDCAKPDKCTIAAAMGVGRPFEVLCVGPSAGEPVEPGDACEIEDATSGVDTCVAGAYCQSDSPGNELTGICLVFCDPDGGDGGTPCGDGDAACALLFGGLAGVCLPTCDPLRDMCGEEQYCYEVVGTAVCVGDSWGV